MKSFDTNAQQMEENLINKYRNVQYLMYVTRSDRHNLIFNLRKINIFLEKNH